jgi:CHASE2 domain-containing sensor protein
MTIIDTINTLQIICLILLGWIIFMVGWLFGAIFTKKYRV